MPTDLTADTRARATASQKQCLGDLARRRARAGRLHRDRRGTMSIVSVFTILFLAMMLGMVMNVARQVDGKIRMQNAADAAAYSGAAVMARGMNTIAFTNHLLCEVFAMTAFLREADSRIEADPTQEPPIVAKPGDAEKFVPQILGAWHQAADMLSGAAQTSPLLQKFTDLGQALSSGVAGGSRDKIKMEQDLVDVFSQWAKQTADLQLALFEQILSEEMIPDYQRRVVEVFPQIAQNAAMETARRNGQPQFGRGEMVGVLWTAGGLPVAAGGSSAAVFPVIDPMSGPAAQAASRHQRSELANRYLNMWNNMLLSFFDFESPNIVYSGRRVTATMSQFGNIWRKYDCGYLNDPNSAKGLLAANSDKNHLYQINAELYGSQEPKPDYQPIILSQYSVLATVYWGSMPHSLPGLFHDPAGSDAMAYAEARFFVPQPRLTWAPWPPTDTSPNKLGGMPGGIQAEPGTGYNPGGPTTHKELPEYWWYYTSGSATLPPAPGVVETILEKIRTGPYREAFIEPTPPRCTRLVDAHARPDDWTLLNQNWTASLVPATQPAWNLVLSSSPAVAGVDYQPPDTSGLGDGNVQAISTH